MLCLEISRRKITKVNDLPPHVLADGQSRFTLGLRVFKLQEFMNVSLDVKPHAILTLRIHENRRVDWLDGSPPLKVNLSVPTIRV
jgi:hypothetical protein